MTPRAKNYYFFLISGINSSYQTLRVLSTPQIYNFKIPEVLKDQRSQVPIVVNNSSEHL